MSRPMARPIARETAAGKPRSQATSPPVTTREETLPAPLPSSRITARQLQTIAANLTPLETDVLGFLAAVRLATCKQLCRRFWIDGTGSDDARARAGRRALKRLSDWRVLDPLPGRARGGLRGGSDTLVYAVGRSGARLLAQRGEAPRRLGAPGQRHIAHTLAVCELVVRLHEASRAGDLELLEIQSEPACWRTFRGGMMGARVVLKPDLFVRIGVGAEGVAEALEDRWAVEVDLSSEHRSTLIAKAKRYHAHYRASTGVHPRVLWTVPDRRRAEQLEDLIRHLPAEAQRLFTVRLFDDTVAYLAAEARS
jgi:hypothetical protein